MKEGPWLDRLFPVPLRDGRTAAVTAFSLVPSNLGILEGGLTAEANAQQRERIVAFAKKRHGEPVVAIDPVITPLPELSTAGRRRERLPWMACIARLSSSPRDPEMLASELTVVWWQDSFAVPLPEEIARAAAAVDWGRNARDVDLW
jgi:hypothetical protein